MTGKTENRSFYWDILKGIGIMMIVAGHAAGNWLGAFVYLFHLEIFFFVSGWFFDEANYGSAPFLYIGRRLEGCWPRYLFYSFFFVLLHNPFVRLGLYRDMALYDRTAMLTSFLSGITFNNTESIQSSLWFVPAWLVSSGIFAGIIRTGQHLPERGRTAAVILLSCLAGAAGVFLNERGRALPYMMQASFAVVPFHLMGYLLRRFLPGFRKYMTWYVCLDSCIILRLLNVKLHLFIDLAGLVIHGFRFYPVAALGIIFSLSLSELLLKVPGLSAWLASVGRHSFDVMALHMMCFKLLDLVFVRLPGNGEIDPGGFPSSFGSRYYPVYIVLSVLVSWAIGLLTDRVFRFYGTLPDRCRK